jgi:hypothetical protein
MQAVDAARDASAAKSAPRPGKSKTSEIVSSQANVELDKLAATRGGAMSSAAAFALALKNKKNKSRSGNSQGSALTHSVVTIASESAPTSAADRKVQPSVTGAASESEIMAIAVDDAEEDAPLEPNSIEYITERRRLLLELEAARRKLREVERSMQGGVAGDDDSRCVLSTSPWVLLLNACVKVLAGQHLMSFLVPFQHRYVLSPLCSFISCAIQSDDRSTSTRRGSRARRANSFDNGSGAFAVDDDEFVASDGDLEWDSEDPAGYVLRNFPFPSHVGFWSLSFVWLTSVSATLAVRCRA